MIYVVVQFTCIIFLITNADFSKLGYFSWGLLITGWIVGYLAIFNMKLDNINILPQLKTHHKLITYGIYHYIRHPMYTSIMLQGLAATLTNPTAWQWLIYLLLIVVLFLKSEKEQVYLSKRFDDYQNYQNKTGRFIPFLFF